MTGIPFEATETTVEPLLLLLVSWLELLEAEVRQLEDVDEQAEVE